MLTVKIIILEVFVLFLMNILNIAQKLIVIFLAKSRSQNKYCCYPKSYTSLLNTLHDQSAVNVIIQNLINKLWFRSDDIFTIENAQKQIGKRR